MDTAAELTEGHTLLARGQIQDAHAFATRLATTRPSLPEARHLLALCQRAAGDTEAAETTLKAGLKRDRGHPGLAIALADLLDAQRRNPEALRILRTALAANRRATPLIARLARALTETGQAAEALALTTPPVNASTPDHAILAAHAAALKALGQLERALAIHQRAATLYPNDPVALHNLAASQGDLARFAAAAHTAARALKSGAAAPQTWLVYARALQGDRQLDEAERAFHQAIARAPTYLEAHRELAQLVWMRTADAQAATATLDAQIRTNPNQPDLFTLRANILDHAGETPAAYATLREGAARHPTHPTLHLLSAQLAAKLPGGAVHALRHAEHACTLLPDSHEAETVLAAACLATGDAARAASLAARLRARQPLDQRAIAYQSTAWRLLNDPRHAALTDHQTFVRAWRMDVPDGWETLPAYLSDLTQALGGVHAFRTHPLDQSVRHGSQAAHLLTSQDPAIRAFFQAVDGPIRRHIAELGTGPDPLRARNTGAYRFHGAWSVRLRPGGFHTDHIHPEGWLSSACYITLPPDGAGQEAWIKFGQPGTPTQPLLGPEHLIRPEPGMLVLFPSYLWHGTVPFTSEATRLSIAFDLLPN